MHHTDLIGFQAAIEPARPAIISGDRIITYGLLEQGVRAVMRRLAEMRLPRGAAIGIRIDDPLRHLAVSIALARLNLVSAPIGAAADLAILPRLQLVLADKPVVAEDAPEIMLVSADWFTPAELGPAPPAAAPSGFCRIVMSSGSTGTPKAIGVTWDALEARAEGVMAAMDVACAATRVQCLMEVASAWGYTIAIGVLARGRTICFAGSPGDSIHMMSLYGADYLVCSAHQLRTLVAHQAEQFVALPALRAISVGGAAAPPDLLAAAQARLCGRILTMYGSAELGLSAFEVLGVRDRQPGDTGIVAPWIEAETVDEEGIAQPPGTTGELRFRGSAYGVPLEPGADLPEATETDAWFHPGDLGRIGADGRLTLLGRSREIINIGGAKTAPEAVEAMLVEFGGVRDAGVAGRMGPEGLEQVVAAIVADSAVDEAALHAFCATRMPTFAPTRFLRVEAIPRTASGKVRRRALDALLDA